MPRVCNLWHGRYQRTGTTGRATGLTGSTACWRVGSTGQASPAEYLSATTGTTTVVVAGTAAPWPVVPLVGWLGTTSQVRRGQLSPGMSASTTARGAGTTACPVLPLIGVTGSTAHTGRAHNGWIWELL